jgi:hypothetical protein
MILFSSIGSSDIGKVRVFIGDVTEMPYYFLSFSCRFIHANHCCHYSVWMVVCETCTFNF